MSRLKVDGKPMRALRVLADTNPAEPLTEYGVWMQAKRDDLDTSTFHEALATLAHRGLAVRTGRRGGYEWYITDAGQAALLGLRTA